MSNWRKNYDAVIMPDGHLRIQNVGQSKGWATSRVTRASWRTLQQIKNELLGADVTCVEIFPAVQDLVDEGDYRHLWPVKAETLPGWAWDPTSPSGRRKR